MEKPLAQQLREEFDLTTPTAAWIVFTHFFVLGSPLALMWATYTYADMLPRSMASPVMILLASAIYIGATAFEVAQNSADRWYLTEATQSVADLFFNSFMTLAFCLYTIGFYTNTWLALVTIVLTIIYPFAYIKNHPSARGISGTVVILACVSLYLLTDDPAVFLFMLGNAAGVYCILFLVKRHAQWMHGWGAFSFGLGFLAWPWAIINAVNGTQLTWLATAGIFVAGAIIMGALTPLFFESKSNPETICVMKSDKSGPVVNRRQFIAGTVATAAAASISTASCSGGPVELPEGVPVGPFDSKSTAEEVTAGVDSSGTTALVTGSNSGIGYETARVLALRGAHVICAARNEEKAVTTSDSIAGNTSPSVFDLADWGSIVDAAEKIRSTGEPIDMLVCNAGIMELPDLQQVNGIERQFAVNHLGHFILVRQLLDQVKAAPQGRIVTVSSGAATRLAPPEGIQFDNLSADIGYDPGQAYGHSKLANVLLALELARRCEGTNVTANSLRPGVIATNLGRYMPRWKTLALETVGSLFTKTIAQGAATTAYVATAPALAETSGHFFNHCNPILAGGYTRDTEMATKLWTVSEEITKDYLI